MAHGTSIKEYGREMQWFLFVRRRVLDRPRECTLCSYRVLLMASSLAGSGRVNEVLNMGLA